MRKIRKKCSIILLIVLISCVTGCSKVNSDIESYLNTGSNIDSNAKDFMPKLDDLPTYKDITYKYTNKSMVIFQAHSVVLVVSYDDETYKNEKAKLEEKYNFLDSKVSLDSMYNVDDGEDKYVIPEHEFLINSYNFRVADENEKNNRKFPKAFGMIGTSDKEKSIAYLYFYDQDLDYIGDKDEKQPMANFVKTYFKYKF
ncbi:hypothetical protein [Clostridium sp. ATCC 25772]|uniref:hypothetical protein n=1 Tax=Clostridium sp. ATCC 25772 TaxID=1676991 RepID=UPI000782F366|nr:hypothetical protein [Clostridium sp. ATCC 25772]